MLMLYSRRVYMQIINNKASISASSNYTMNSSDANQDNYIKSLQKQIENVQKQLQSLSENNQMPPKEKMERRKILQQQIQDLNRQIAQRKIEIQQEKLAAATKEEKQGSRQKSKVKGDPSTPETADMQGLIRADSSMKQVNTLHSVKTKLEGKSRVLENEIKLSRGGPTERKGAELSKLKDRIRDASDDIMDKISDISEELDEAEDVQDGIGGTQEEDLKEDTVNTNRGKNKAGQQHVTEEKSGSSDKTVTYTKTGEASKPESESKLSLLV